MTTKQKQDRKQLIKNRASKKPAAPPRDDYAEAKADAYRLENEAKWAEAAIAWGLALDCAATTKDKKTAAGRLAAAKVRVKAVTKAMEEQIEKQVEWEAAGATGEADDLGMDEVADEMAAAGEDIASGAEDVETRAATAEEMAKEAKGQKPAKAEKQAKERDPRLPSIGTVIIKKDRAGAERAHCTVVEGGIEYKGAICKTLSAAGLKAMADLGLKAETCDGFAFWGLKKGETRVVTMKESILEQLQKTWERYLERATAAAQIARTIERAASGGMVDDHKECEKLNAMLAGHLEALRQLMAA